MYHKDTTIILFKFTVQVTYLTKFIIFHMKIWLTYVMAASWVMGIYNNEICYFKTTQNLNEICCGHKSTQPSRQSCPGNMWCGNMGMEGVIKWQ